LWGEDVDGRNKSGHDAEKEKGEAKMPPLSTTMNAILDLYLLTASFFVRLFSMDHRVRPGGDEKIE
jgi:hypothetical protein